MLLGLVLGCSDDDPASVKIYPRDYNTAYTVTPDTNPVVLEVLTHWIPYGYDPPRVFIDTTPSEDEQIRMTINVVGEATEPNGTAEISHMWRGDTLSVWCASWTPQSWKSDSGLEKNQPLEPWFIPKRVDVQIPEGVDLEYRDWR